MNDCIGLPASNFDGFAAYRAALLPSARIIQYAATPIHGVLPIAITFRFGNAVATFHFSLYTTPSFITNATFSSKLTSLVGSPSTAMMSADFPALIDPIKSLCPSKSAEFALPPESPASASSHTSP